MATNNSWNSEDPVQVSLGGSGAIAFAAYAPVVGGTTNTSPLQSASTGISTVGNFLISQGSSALPIFASGSSSGASLQLISTQLASVSSSIIFTGIVPTQLLLTMTDVAPVTNGDQLQILASNDNGATYANTGYQSGVNYNLYNSATSTNVNSTASFVLCGPAQSVMSGYMDVFNTDAGASMQIRGGMTWIDNGSTSLAFGTFGGQSGISGINAIKIQFSSGNIQSGRFTLYAYLVS